METEAFPMTWVAETYESRAQILFFHVQVIVQFLLPAHTAFLLGPL